MPLTNTTTKHLGHIAATINRPEFDKLAYGERCHLALAAEQAAALWYIWDELLQISSNIESIPHK